MASDEKRNRKKDNAEEQRTQRVAEDSNGATGFGMTIAVLGGAKKEGGDR